MNHYTPVEIAKEVHDILSDYIEVNNDMFAFSLRKVIPIPLFFQKIDYKKVKEDVEIVMMNLEACLYNLNEISIQNRYGSSELIFIQKLGAYIQSLLKTNSLLYEFANRLDLKVQGIRAFTYREYHLMFDTYDESVKQYRLVGLELNHLYQSIR